MDARTAIRNINDMSFAPGWRFRASRPDLHRHGMRALFVGDDPGTIFLEVDYDAADSTAWNARGDKTVGEIGTTFPLDVSGVRDIDDLESLVFATFMYVQEHEAREFFRSRGKSPFHPHTPDGERRWRDHGPALKRAQMHSLFAEATVGPSSAVTRT